MTDASGALDRRLLIEAVLARNPSIASAREAWRAATARVPQARAWDDPMLSYAVAPLTIGSSTTSFGERVMLSQRLPIAGKNRRQAAMADAEAAAMRGDLEQLRRSLALMASQAYDDLRQIDRALVINQEHLALLRELKTAADARVAAGQASLQDPLAAEVDVVEAEHRAIELGADRAVAAAQLDGLLHRRGGPLPAPPQIGDAGVAVPPEPAPSDELQRRALAARPEVASARARLRAGDAGAGLARSQRYPDVSIDLTYDTMWMDHDQQYMAGVSFAVPLQRARIDAAIDEADAHRAQARHEVERQEDDVRVDVERTRARLVESRHLLMLEQDRLLPAAQAQLASARAGYESGRNGFADLVAAERNLLQMRLMIAESIADVARRQADLVRAVGGMPGIDATPGAGGAP